MPGIILCASICKLFLQILNKREMHNKFLLAMPRVETRVSENEEESKQRC